MKPIFEHQWNVSELEAISLQERLSAKVVRFDQIDCVNYISGVDVAYSKSSETIVAAAVVLDVNTLEIVESSNAEGKSSFPYVPGLFSFRELPILIKALDKLKITPDLIVCDGQGYAHPRRFGLACHLGVLFDIPTIGCGKNHLLGEFQLPAAERGETEPLVHRNEVIGLALRTQYNIKPIFVSIGHRISIETACEWVLKLTPKYRLPETTRLADQLVNRRLKDKLKSKK